MSWIERAPIWLIALMMVVGLIASHELGIRVARTWGEGGGDERGYLVSSALALLGLLMAFTFGAAEERFLLRQQLVVAEANALGTTYLRFQLLDQPWRAALSRQVLRYAEVRAGFDQALDPASVAANARQTAAEQDRIWPELAAAMRARTAPGVDLALLNTVNETFDLAATRRAAREASVPAPVLYALLISCFLVAWIVGYAGQAERRLVGISVGVMALVTLAFCLILDLDRPVAGTVLVNPAPMGYAVDAIRRSEAAKPPAIQNQ